MSTSIRSPRPAPIRRALAGLVAASVAWSATPQSAAAATTVVRSDAESPAGESSPADEVASPGTTPSPQGAAPTGSSDDTSSVGADAGPGPAETAPAEGGPGETPEAAGNGAGTAAPTSTDTAADPGSASPSDANGRAANAFREGSDAYELGRFAEAAEKFGTAWELSHKAPLLYNLGQAHWKWFDVDPDIEHLRQARLFFTNYDKRMRLTDAYDAAEIEANLAKIQQQIDEEEQRIAEANRPVIIQSAALSEEELQREHRRKTTRALNISGIALIVAGAAGLGTGLGGLGSRAAYGAVLNNTTGRNDTMLNLATAQQDERRRASYLVSGQIAFGALIAGAIVLPIGITLRSIGARRMKADRALGDEADGAPGRKKRRRGKQARATVLPSAGGVMVRF